MPSQSGISGPPFTIPGLTPLRSYRARVRATNSVGSSSWTSWVPFDTLATGGGDPDPDPGGRPTALNVANLSGPYYTEIPASPVLDTSSSSKSAIINNLQKLAGLQWITTCFAIPGDPYYSIVYDVDPDVQPGQDIEWAYQAYGWGRAEEVEPVRIPDPPNFYPMPGGYADGSSWDGWGCAVDLDRGIGWAGWRMVKVGNNWQAATSHSFNVTGDLSAVTGGLGRGDGLSAIAGSITVQEVAAAMADTTDTYTIPHALAGSLPAGIMDTQFRAPAVKTDGAVTPSSSTISQGSRFFLPASATVSSSNRLIRAITRTLKKFGIYIVDRNGSGSSPGSLMVNFERFNPADPTNMVAQGTGANSTLSTPSSISRVYYDAGLTIDYASLASVPWGSLQLLRNWQGT